MWKVLVTGGQRERMVYALPEVGRIEPSCSLSPGF